MSSRLMTQVTAPRVQMLPQHPRPISRKVPLGLVVVFMFVGVWLKCEGAWMVGFILAFDSHRRRVGVPVILESGSHGSR